MDGKLDGPLRDRAAKQAQPRQASEASAGAQVREPKGIFLRAERRRLEALVELLQRQQLLAKSHPRLGGDAAKGTAIARQIAASQERLQALLTAEKAL